MDTTTDLHDQALAYHQRLPQRLWKYLNGRGIPDALIHKHLLGWNGRRITIPIPDRTGEFAFFKLTKDPEDQSDSPKMLATPRAHAELYGWERVLAKPDQIIICEGEFDRLVLESREFEAVTSTAGASFFRSEWAECFREIRHVYICFDNDAAGQTGAEQVGRIIPHGRIVRLPQEVGVGGDVTDFFVRLRKSHEEFLRLLEAAQPLPKEDGAEETGPRKVWRPQDDVHDVKSRTTIQDIVGRYVSLRPSGVRYLARCPFHEDHDPSFVVYPETQSFYCFGCREHGDVLSFLMHVENLNFGEAVKVLRRLTP